MTIPESVAGPAARALARAAEHVPHDARDVLVAVSGGADSVALALVLDALERDGRLPAALAIAHVDHGTRAESAVASRRVGRLADALGRRVVTRQLRLDADASEATMRTARYAALAAMADEVGAGILATAHHADDDAETVLLRLLRGTGVRGLAGIHGARPLRRESARPWLVRPVLGSRRAELRRIVDDAGCAIDEDPTNRDVAKRRNAIRHVVLPALRAHRGPAWVDATLAGIAADARDLARRTDALVERLDAACVRWPAPWRCELSTAGLDAELRPIVAAMVQRLVERLIDATPARSWTRRAVALLDGPPGRRLSAGGPVLVERTRAGLLLADLREAGAPPPAPLPFDVACSTPTRFGTTEHAIVAHRGSTAAPHRLGASRPSHGRDRRVAVVAADALAWPLRLRPVRPGERVTPFGRDRPVELNGFLARRGVPVFDRDRLPLLVDALDRLVWIGGVEIAEAVKILPTTRQRIELRVVPAWPAPRPASPATAPGPATSPP